MSLAVRTAWRCPGARPALEHLLEAAILVATLAVLSTTGCTQDTTAAAAEGSRAPMTDEPTGPVPGPGDVTPRVNPFAGEPEAIADGRRYFVAFNCAGCHGDHGGGGMGPSLRDRDWIYGDTPGKIHASISQGRAHGMPSWGTRLPEDTVWKLTTYIDSLGTQAEAEPPR